eukprot:TRINITY_DN958_c0_g1_i2.p1 TRINITY_DN958_c0_g1~~TRINITY_DN958_c0_g1_i2.p1  ORF type:complete len:275 (-),score=48.42 TRINITY_DN958_c0_g1_i2:365-1189(-)
MYCIRSALQRTHSYTVALQSRGAATATNFQSIKISPDDDGMRLDRWLRNRLNLPQSLLEKHLRKKDVSVSTTASPTSPWVKVGSNTRLQAGQYVLLSSALEEKKEVPVPEKEISPELTRILRSWVIYKDKHIIVLNKPAKVAVQGATDSVASLLGAFKYDYDEKPSIVHRLDKDTSGILLLARTKPVARDLSEAWRNHKVKKMYWAILVGKPEKRAGMIRAALTRRNKRDGDEPELVRLADPNSTVAKEEAVTAFNMIEWLGSTDSGFVRFFFI